MERTYTVAEIVAAALTLRPRDAARLTNGDRAKGSSTPVYTRIRLEDGSVSLLAKIDGRYGAGYARVSSRRQQQDGWSQEDQIVRIVRHFAQQGQAFRIFSDAGIPGSYPYNTPDGSDHLARRLAEKRALRYETAYTKIFLENPKYAPQRVGMDAHLAKTLAAIRSGSLTEVPLVDAEKEALLEGERESAPRRMGRPSVAPEYRPGLTTLVESLSDIHTLAVTDLSRISRSQILFADLAERLTTHRVRVAGLMEDLSWVSGSGDIGADIVAYVLSRLAEHRLGELVINILRGQVTKLEAGEASGLLPSWIVRQADGSATLHEERAPLVRRVVDLALKGVAMVRIAIMFAEEGIHAFGHNGRGAAEGRTWHSASIQKILRNPALRGKQVLFGIEWNILPPLVTEGEWHRIQERLDETSKTYPRRFNRYLASQLFRCSCGRKMTRRPVENVTHQYACCTQPAERKVNPGVRHVTFNEGDVEKFINALMRFDPAVVTGAWRDTEERERLAAELERLETARQELKGRLPAEQQRARDEAVEKARLLLSGDDGDAGADEDLVAAVVRRMVAPSLRRLDELDREIRERRRQLESLLPSDEILAIESRVQQWDSLSAPAKNELLLTLFQEWRVEGHPPNECVIPVLHTLAETSLPPIWIKTQVRGRALHRRFPTVDEWVASWGDTAAKGE